MATPVTGGITPMSLGELRQAVLAVVIGNPLFSDAEQLNINHAAYEIEDAEEMAQLLRGLRLKDAERGFMQRNYVARDLPQPGVCHCEDTLKAERRNLLGCPALDTRQKCHLAQSYVGSTTRDRLGFMGFWYQQLLENRGLLRGRLGYSALLDN